VAGRRPVRGPAVGVPAFLALGYCLYTAFIAGNNGHSTGTTWLIALVSAFVVGVLCFAVGRWQSARRREPESMGIAYGAVFGGATGFLLSLNGSWSLLKSSLVGLVLAAALGVCVVYVVHTHRLLPFSKAR
jgi:hypothetical protein